MPPSEPTTEERAALIAEAKTLIFDLPEDASFDLALLAGGATGQTFKLEVTIPGQGTPKYALRTMRPDREEDQFLARCSEALGSAGIGPQVFAKTEKMILCEFIDGENASIASLCDPASPQITLIAKALGRYHSLPIEAIAEPLRPWSGDEFPYWINLVEKTYADSKIPAEFQAVIDAQIAAAKAFTTEIVAASASSDNQFAKMLGSVTVTHGDLHPNNIIINKEVDDCVVVDHEMTRGRPAAFDIAYHFMVWGDMRFYIGWKPSPEEPGPYAPLACRQAFAKQYLLQRVGEEKGSAMTDADIANFLFEVEKFGYAERVRLFLIWLLMTGGDHKHMMFGGAQLYLPRMTSARDLLLEAAAGNEELKQEIVRRGVIVTANARAEAKKE